MADSASGMSKALATTTSFIEKAVEMRHFMLLISFILALDSCLVIFYHKNLLGAFSKLDAPEVSGGNALVFLGLFAFLMTLLFPALRHILLVIPTYISIRWPNRNHQQRDPDLRWTSIVRKKALIERDKVMLEILEKKQAAHDEEMINMNIGFAMAMLLALNFLVLGDNQTITLSQTAAFLHDTLTGFWVSVLVNFCLGGIVIFCVLLVLQSLTPNVDGDRIYLPESDEECKARLEEEAKRAGK
ncbi:hypothetical protein V2K57_25595 [Pseudomonas alliivorans]|uniref:hypothetical protein n=1 Tax=Pseudomonas alliivorans TaxID=2810613 RepID=UPI00211CF99E|nr:hypothetical protein [Pseudomonas alliivorans]MCQ9473397.1 hypothetical protein [Pseudomonas alliivorans]MEE4677683.1 hypothetical protein [Pseudomonas alliivorans]MEE4703791.1 hypothetical protein [Pseudomonas alliivorans]MEE4739765.1 hypothetical protein [Pseudomonas alliivorans]MEE4740642.1 hypothetical protein [Pseudomonas alliivorans]